MIEGRMVYPAMFLITFLFVAACSFLGYSEWCYYERLREHENTPNIGQYKTKGNSIARPHGTPHIHK